MVSIGKSSQTWATRDRKGKAQKQTKEEARGNSTRVNTSQNNVSQFRKCAESFPTTSYVKLVVYNIVQNVPMTMVTT